MDDKKKLILNEILNLTRNSEKKYRVGDFKGAVEDKRKVNRFLKSNSCDDEMIRSYKEELSSLYLSKFDLIYDHKKRISDLKREKIINSLEQKSNEKYDKGDFRGAVKALRRAEKYK